jgi:hypothetical protein
LTKLNLQSEQLSKIKELAKLEKGSPYVFLGYSLDLETGNLNDLIGEDKTSSERTIQILSTLLLHYASAISTPKTGRLIKFKDLPGGCAYEKAFIQRAVQPIAEVFGDKSADLVKAAKLVGGKQINFGDVSVEISALEGVPLTYVLWRADEFPASSSALYDESASCFLPTEDLAVLGELTTHRLKEAYSILKLKK